MQSKILLSVFKNTFDKDPKNATLSVLIEKIKRSLKLKNLCSRLQAISDPAERQKFKQENFPAIAVSGIFKNGHASNSLIQHSGLIQIDIDDLNTSGSKSVTEWKKILQLDPYSFILFISVSRSGLKIFVRIDGSNHKESFYCLEKYYKDRYHLAIDPKCKDIGRLCFLGFDPDIWVNETASCFIAENSLPEADKRTESALSDTNYENDIEIITKRIEADKIDITTEYDNWVKLGFALTDAMGELGRRYFHRLSKFYPYYDPKQADKQYSDCLKSSKRGITAKTFFHLAQTSGIEVNIKKNNLEINQGEIGDEHINEDELPSNSKEIIFYSPVFDKNQNIIDVRINYTKFYEVLQSLGFKRFDVEHDFIMVRINENIIEEAKTNTIQDSFYNYLEHLPESLHGGIKKETLVEKFNRSPEIYF